MTSAKHALPIKKNTPVPGWLENTLLCIVLGLLVLRSTIIEAPLVDQLQTRLMLSSENITLLMSTILLACIMLWLLVSIFCGQFHWRKAGFGIAVGLFIVAGILAVCFASNKRMAITDLVTLATPMLAGLFLVQLLTSAAKIRMTLLLILAVGAAATVLCLMQLSFLNDDMIKSYEENPDESLAKQGIDPGSLEFWMYEHRMYSKDIHGFLLTSNSAASFFLLTIFAAMGLCVETFSEFMKPRPWADREQVLVALLCYFLGFAGVLLGLFLTRSKGGIGAFMLGTLLFTVLVVFGKAIWMRRWVFGVLLLLLVVVAAGVIIHYGIQHGRLPGGNSMLVRWQYWASTTEMIRDHFLAGVGGGNFPEFYTHYKIPAALETVQNPHNWILSLLSQYGPLGLAAFVAAALILFVKALNHSLAPNAELQESPQQPAGRLWVGMLVFSAAMLLLVRPVLVDVEFFYQKSEVAAAAYLILYFIPALVFTLAFVLLRKASVQDTGQTRNGHSLSIALVCGLVAVLIHNVIDFAIFEPGNWSVFWLFAAILIVQIDNAKRDPGKSSLLAPSTRLGLCAGLVVVSVVYLAVVLLPPMRAELLFKRAMVGGEIEGFALMDKAVAADPLSAKTAFQAANMLTQVYKSRDMDNQPFLDRAAGFADITIQRSPADFKHWRLRAKINVIRSEQTEDAQKEKYLQMAFNDLQQAITCYPGSGKLHSLLANISEQLNRPQIALCYYQTAVEIEDAYRAQFRVMYPDRKTVISRLGDAAYTEARSKIDQLQENEWQDELY